MSACMSVSSAKWPPKWSLPVDQFYTSDAEYLQWLQKTFASKAHWNYKDMRHVFFTVVPPEHLWRTLSVCLWNRPAQVKWVQGPHNPFSCNVEFFKNIEFFQNFTGKKHQSVAHDIVCQFADQIRGTALDWLKWWRVLQVDPVYFSHAHVCAAGVAVPFRKSLNKFAKNENTMIEISCRFLADRYKAPCCIKHPNILQTRLQHDPFLGILASFLTYRSIETLRRPLRYLDNANLINDIENASKLLREALNKRCQKIREVLAKFLCDDVIEYIVLPLVVGRST